MRLVPVVAAAAALGCRPPVFPTAPLPYETLRADEPVPGTAGGSLSIQLAPGPRLHEFHVTFEREGVQHVRFDGGRWSAPVAITQDRPFRSGAHVAVGPDQVAHFTWGTDRTSPCLYRQLRPDGTLSPVETVEARTAWGECDVAVDGTGRVLVALTRESEGLSVYERGDGGWRPLVEFNRPDTQNARWSPSLVVTDRVVVFARKKPDDHPLVWHASEGSGWSEERVLPGNKKEPHAVALGKRVVVAALGGLTVIEPDAQGVLQVRASPLPVSATFKRGQTVGLGLTPGGLLFASYAEQPGENALDRRIDARARVYFAVSTDVGRTWLPPERPTKDAGQGWGQLAANGRDVLLVWPDVRGGSHLRFSHLRAAR